MIDMGKSCEFVFGLTFQMDFQCQSLKSSLPWGATLDDFSGQFFGICEIFFCFVVAICDLVHDVETIFHLSYALKAAGNLF